MRLAGAERLCFLSPAGMTRVVGGLTMIRRSLLAVFCALGLASGMAATAEAQEQAYGRQWARSYNTQDWDRFYHYPYLWYPQNFWSADYYRSSESLYYRYPQEMRVPVYNKKWMNFYPEGNLYHSGHHFILDTF